MQAAGSVERDQGLKLRTCLLCFWHRTTTRAALTRLLRDGTIMADQATVVLFIERSDNRHSFETVLPIVSRRAWSTEVQARSPIDARQCSRERRPIGHVVYMVVTGTKRRRREEPSQRSPIINCSARRRGDRRVEEMEGQRIVHDASRTRWGRGPPISICIEPCDSSGRASVDQDWIDRRRVLRVEYLGRLAPPERASSQFLHLTSDWHWNTP
jgi:hypothetical protein